MLLQPLFSHAGQTHFEFIAKAIVQSQHPVASENNAVRKPHLSGLPKQNFAFHVFPYS
jgi:hypothetical protein